MAGNEQKDNIKELIKFIKASSESFDMDMQGEARRIAMGIKALVHDTPGSPSLLEQAGVKNKIHYYDNTPEYNPSLRLPFSGLAVVVIGSTVTKYVARLGDNPRVPMREVPFDLWWNKPVVIDEDRKLNMSREALVLAVINSNVGMVDSKLTESFKQIMRKISNVIVEGPAFPGELAPMFYASIRQIAFELINALNDQRPEYF